MHGLCFCNVYGIVSFEGGLGSSQEVLGWPQLFQLEKRLLLDCRLLVGCFGLETETRTCKNIFIAK